MAAGKCAERDRWSGTLQGSFLLSLLIHAGLIAVAGAITVFRAEPRSMQAFRPPSPVVVPKMPLEKPRFRLERPSRPPASRVIIADVPSVPLNAIQLPEPGSVDFGADLAVAGDWSHASAGGLCDDSGVLGSGHSIGSDLEGTFYDFKRNRRGGYTGAGDRTYKDKIRNFMRRGWNTAELSKFYRSPKKIYTTMIVVPTCSSAVAPMAFGEENAVGRYWMIHYRGVLVHTEDITFRFRGSGDEILAVRVDGEMVLAACWPTVQETFVGDIWQTRSSDSRRYYMGNNTAVVGDWITLEAGTPRRIEILLGDNGGEACAMLAVEVKGVEYVCNRQGGPILPAFRTAAPARSLLDVIYKDLPEGEICLTNGPVFCDFGSVASGGM